ncbi:putative UDP-N-acetylglucosamine--dolichyl-phosphate n-acetylglucosaminephosphotransferase [Trypanosoma vivax]|nr:putative UDP-N-acetylglucosamine--dolichyl-phosphate n-acetylglucosaminephosphotransferase [Trypanosoma vivax]
MNAVTESGQRALLAVYTYSYELMAILVSGAVAYSSAMHFMQPVRQKLLEQNICGVDINKTTAEQRRRIAHKRLKELDEHEKQLVVPESLGILVGAVYLSSVLLVVFVIFGSSARHLDGALTSTAISLLLGFVDDVLDLRWRYKLLLSAIGTIPHVMTYKGRLDVKMPSVFMSYVDFPYLYLGGLYLFGLSMLNIFFTNSINILAGVNGVEVGQSIVIAVACIIHCIFQLRLENDSMFEGSQYVQSQLMSIALLVPFVGVSLALWRYNCYPARVFVGDSYTYFSGTVLSVAGVTGQYSKTLVLFFAPQFVNFVLSLPQLLHFVPCPRHRVPKWDPERDVMQNSGNYTLLNAILFLFGDMHERKLTRVVIILQICFCVLAMIVRYFLASLLYDRVF